MDFTDKEYDIIFSKNVDKIVFYNKESKAVLSMSINEIITRKLDKDPTLKKSVLQLALKSEE
jgi:hypothetical protein